MPRKIWQAIRHLRRALGIPSRRGWKQRLRKIVRLVSQERKP